MGLILQQLPVKACLAPGTDGEYRSGVADLGRGLGPGGRPGQTTKAGSPLSHDI